MNTVPRFASREELADGFERLIEREFQDHRRHLLATARSILRNSEDAEDAVQVAFILAWRSRHQLRGTALFHHWMTVIVRNAALDVLRRRGNRPDAHVKLDEARACTPAMTRRQMTPEEALLERERTTIVRTAVGRLPQRMREAMEQSLEGNAPHPIEGWLKVLRWRAMKKLKKTLRVG